MSAFFFGIGDSKNEDRCDAPSSGDQDGIVFISVGGNNFLQASNWEKIQVLWRNEIIDQMG